MRGRFNAKSYKRKSITVNGGHHLLAQIAISRSSDCRFNAAVVHDSCVLSQSEQDSEALAVEMYSYLF